MEYFFIGTLVVTNLIFIFLFKYYRKKHKENVQFYLERQFNEVLNSMHQAILLFDKKGKLLFYNRYSEIVLLLKTSNLGQTAEEIFNNKKFSDDFKKNENYKVFDITFLNKIYLVNVYKTQKTFSNNKIDIIVTLNNVTEDRKIEETKRDFFAHASHELKSPLTAILGYSELVSLNMVEKEEYLEIIQRIYNQANHMSLLVEDMSILSRLETLTEREEFYEIVNLNKVLKETLYTLEPFINEKNIYINLIEEQIEYKCIELDINKLFKNLIENAIKYSNDNGSIEIRLYQDREYVVFEVKDEGIGIEPENLEKVFQRFYRVDKGRLEPGTGLGLAIVKHTVIKYDGKIDIKSEINKGTTIKIKLKV